MKKSFPDRHFAPLEQFSQYKVKVPFISRTGPSRSLLLAFGFTVQSLVAVNGQVLESAQHIVQRDLAWLHANGFPNAEFGVAVYKLRYWTPDLTGATSIASAAYVVPLENCNVPLACFIHGTEYLKTDAPSSWEDSSGAVDDGYSLGGDGFACVLPDLLGLGDSPGHHPYLNASANARASIDAVRAAREFQIQQGNALDDQLFLIGVSAGAHTCMATNEMMQDDYSDEFNVTAAGAVSGPYAIYPTIKDIMTLNQPFITGADLVYLLLGYQAAYPGLFSSPSDFLVSPYNTILPPYYDGMHAVGEINQHVPAVPSAMIPVPLKEDIAHHPDAPLNQRFKENNVYDWAPQNPIRLCYCGGDITVPPSNSIIAHDSLVANGGTSVGLFELSTTADHGQCGGLARPFLTSWFLSLKTDCIGNTETGSILLQPDPAIGGKTSVSLQLDNSESGSGTMQVVDDVGRTVIEQPFSYLDGSINIQIDLGAECSPGMYFVLLKVGSDRYTGKVVVQGG